MKAEYRAWRLASVGSNIVQITMGEKNLRDSLVILPPHGRSCISSIKDIELHIK
jgi:hypothetical protein